MNPNDGGRVAAWHWHPDSNRSPIHYAHFHTPFDTPNNSLHYPTGRVTIESVVRFAIEELGARPQTNSWERTLAVSEELHKNHRGWS